MKSLLIKKIIQFTWRPYILNHLKKERTFRHQGISIIVKPGVFHPRFFFSSLLLIDFLKQKDIRQKKLLDLGAGAGLLAIYAAKNGAQVTAVDISRTSIENINLNSENNNVKIDVFLSDLFEALQNKIFDYILVNPPYYKKKPKLEAEFAWFCGEHMEYFHRLFKQLPVYLNANGSMYMILSQDCDISEITHIAIQNNCEIREVFKQKKLWEWNFIFEIKVTPSAR